MLASQDRRGRRQVFNKSSGLTATISTNEIGRLSDMAITSQAASSTRRSKSPAAAKLLPHIRELANSLSTCTQAELHSEAASLRAEFATKSDHTAPELLVAGIALAFEALRRAHGIELYDVQLSAVLDLAKGRIAQMQTGEGKTFVAVTTAVHLAIPGRGVHVMTPNAYLAERDCEVALPVLQQLNMTVGLTPEQGETDDKRAAYDCDVTYGTGHEFGFDYLRDQLTLRREATATLGMRLLHDLHANGPGQRSTMQRGLIHAVIDEADSVLIDDAASPLVLSMSAEGLASDRQAHLAAMDVANVLEIDNHYRHDISTGNISLTPTGMDRCYDDDIAVPASVLLRPWTSYIEQALRAKLIFRRNVHYIVADDEVRIVDESTGRIFEDRSWQDGLHQAIEAKEGLPVTPEKESLAQITRQRFFRLYQNLCGMTGTAVGCEAEFNHVYRSRIAEIPLRLPPARITLPTRFFTNRQAKHTAIAEAVKVAHKGGQAVLIGTQSISESEMLSEMFQQQGLTYQLLNGLQSAEEADVISVAGQQGAITIATNLAGRGTDISIPREVLEVGGLHVIVAECQLSSRMDRQLIGRGARQGNPGTAQTFVSAEDALVKRFGQWLGTAITREANDDGEAIADYSTAVQRLQAVAEKQQFRARAELLRKDIARDSLFGNDGQN